MKETEKTGSCFTFSSLWSDFIKLDWSSCESGLCSQCELKETGHTPELTAEHDGKGDPVKRQTAANRRPRLQKSRSQEADRQTVVSESRYTEWSFSYSCSPQDEPRLENQLAKWAAALHLGLFGPKPCACPSLVIFTTQINYPALCRAGVYTFKTFII